MNENSGLSYKDVKVMLFFPEQFCNICNQTVLMYCMYIRLEKQECAYLQIRQVGIYISVYEVNEKGFA